jgi:hypothetical protein
VTNARELAEKRRTAAEMRLAGASYEQIARQLEYRSVSSAHDAVQAGMAAAMQDPDSEIRRMELDRLDVLLVGLWPKARRGDVAAVDRVLKVMERRSRYLGLDATAESGPAKPSGKSDIEIQRERRAERRSAAARS